MSKWYGRVGFCFDEETTPGNYKHVIDERFYKGDLIKNVRRVSTIADSTNDRITLSDQISFLADDFAYSKFPNIRYVEFMGAKWAVTMADASQRPRIILDLGGVYNG